MFRMLTYPIRRLWWCLVAAELPCYRVWCAKPRVGFSNFCREHTDEILERTNDAERT